MGLQHPTNEEKYGHVAKGTLENIQYVVSNKF